METLDKVVIAHTIMLVVGVCISSRIISHTSSAVHAQKDPARTAFKYLRFAFAAFCAYALFAMILVSSNVARYYLSKNIDGTKELMQDSLYKALGSCSQIAELMTVTCELSIDTLIAFILPRLVTAILNVHFGSAELTRKVIRVAFRVIGFVLVALNFVLIALQLILIYFMLYGPEDVPIAFIMSFGTMGIRFAFKHVVIVTSLAAAAGSVVIKTQAEDGKSLAWASTMLVSASMVWLLHACMVSGWIQFVDNLYVYSFQFTFGIWSQFAVLIMVYIMLDKANGVWSGQQETLMQAKKWK